MTELSDNQAPPVLSLLYVSRGRCAPGVATGAASVGGCRGQPTNIG